MMNLKISRYQKFQLYRLLLGQIPAIAILFMIFSGEFLKLSLISKVIFCIFFIANIITNIFFIREMKNIKVSNEGNHTISNPRNIQVIYIFGTFILLLICIFRYFSVIDNFQKIIALVCSIISFMLLVLLIWGLKYYKK
ncbi:hypothetical protein [Streptococcus ovuberis]|uniref:Immunity protein n=1 Tax=Streptococcus ovuberis TaxID=1936207 RepID=A0A7X6MXE6_9STRE|nr:hypothetical protein [Streptococcus ovuberis]NKZ20140.1 hypothetical protein [Streptococcus ovuberis]